MQSSAARRSEARALFRGLQIASGLQFEQNEASLANGSLPPRGVHIGRNNKTQAGVKTVAIQFNTNALSAFSNMNFGENDAMLLKGCGSGKLCAP